jgi:hypothetical protein
MEKHASLKNTILEPMKAFYNHFDSMKEKERLFFKSLKSLQDKCKEERFLDELLELCDFIYRDFRAGYKEYRSVIY